MTEQHCRLVLRYFHAIELQTGLRAAKLGAVETLVQVVTVALAVVAIIWHQQRTIDKLRSTARPIEKLRTLDVASNGERLARIEGFLGIGMPERLGWRPPAERVATAAPRRS